MLLSIYSSEIKMTIVELQEHTSRLISHFKVEYI